MDLRANNRLRHLGDVAENRDFISLSHEMEIPMAEIARHVGYVDQLSLRQFEKWSQQIRFIGFINVSYVTLCRTSLDFIYKTCNFVYKREVEMRTLVDISEDVLKEAMEVSETATKKETITLALKELIKSRLRQRLKSMAGSGIMGTGLSDLRRLRRRREKIQKVLRAVAKR